MDDVPNDHFAKLPPKLRDVYQFLEHEVMRLNAEWMDYRDLFLTDAQQIDVLNRTASSFFAVCKSLLANDILLSIARITDPPSTFGKENISLDQLLSLLQELGPSPLSESTVKQISAIKENAAPIREWRNRRITHNDLATTLKYSDDPLPGISVTAVTSILSSIGECLNRVLYHFTNASCWYDMTQRDGGANRLLRHLHNALNWQKNYFDSKRGGTA